MRIKEVADLAKVSVRTLQYYDKIGLLHVKKDRDNGYREYDSRDIDRLQEILLFRELDFQLKDITKLIAASEYERLDALKMHQSVTVRRMEQLGKLLDNINGSILEIERGIKMKKSDKFKGMDFRENPYEQEARDKWGNQVVDDTKAKMNEKSDEERSGFQDRMNQIFAGFAALVGENPTSIKAMEQTKAWHQLLNKEVGDFYNKEIFKKLGQMYVEDKRFAETLDRWGQGTAQFMRDAMVFYSDNYL